MVNENDLEQLILEWFQDAGWQYTHGPDLSPDGPTPERTDYRQVVLRGRLRAALARLNPHLPPAAWDQAAQAVTTHAEPLLVAQNHGFHRALLDGVPVGFSVNGEKKADVAQVVDFADPARNEFLVVNQFTISGTKGPRRPDLSWPSSTACRWPSWS